MKICKFRLYVITFLKSQDGKLFNDLKQATSVRIFATIYYIQNGRFV